MGNIVDVVTLAPGGSLLYLVNADVSPSATGSLSNTVSISLPVLAAAIMRSHSAVVIANGFSQTTWRPALRH